MITLTKNGEEIKVEDLSLPENLLKMIAEIIDNKQKCVKMCRRRDKCGTFFTKGGFNDGMCCVYESFYRKTGY